MTLRPFLAALVLLAPSVVAAQQPFDAPWFGFNAGTTPFAGNPNPTLRYPSAVATADLDGDGDLDAAVSNWPPGALGGGTNSGFAVLFNDGTGALTTTVHYTVSTLGSWDVAAGDFDEDGDADLAVTVSNQTHSSGNTVEVWMNNGAGAFTRAATPTVGLGPIGLVAADLNGDGNLDLATANGGYVGGQAPHQVSVLLGNGNGGFAPHQLYEAGPFPQQLEAGDLDGDGDRELVVANSEQQVTVLVNNGSGAFPTRTAYGPFFPPRAGSPDADVVLADADTDGDHDVFYGSPRAIPDGFNDPPQIVHLRNNGAGALTRRPDIPLRIGAMDAAAEDLFATDLDGDGDQDLLFANSTGGAFDGIGVVRNTGGAFTFERLVTAGHETVAVVAADLDEDGDPDVVTADGLSLAVTVHPNRGGTFENTPATDTNTSGSALDLGDVDSDGDHDALVTGGLSGSPAAIMRNNGDGTYAIGQWISNTSCSFGKLRDLDGDGDLDAVCHSPRNLPPYDFFTSVNNGNGQFGPLVRHAAGSCGWGDDTEAADLDEDGDLDVINTETGGCFGNPNSGNQLFVSFNNGNITFQPPLLVPLRAGASTFEVADFNEDGHLDVAALSGPNTFLPGNGDGTFGPSQTFTLSPNAGPIDLVAVDLDGDGHLDLASANTDNPNLAETMGVTFGTGTGQFTGARLYYAPYAPSLRGATGIAAADGDGDGDTDLFVSNAGSNDVAFYENTGARQFTFDTRFGVGPDADDVQVADVTGDGRPDLAALVGPQSFGIGALLAVVPGLEGGPPPAPLAVAAQPVGGPVVIGSNGGSFQFTVTLTNLTSQTQTFQAWTAVTGPVNRDPVVGPLSVTLPAGGSITRTLTQPVPGAAPAGTYTYAVKVGTFPGVVLATDSFPFTKQAARLAAGTSTGSEADWTATGWDDAMTASASAALPGGFSLSEAYPNPSASQARITLEVAAAQAVRVEVYDALGRRVAVLHAGPMEAGAHALTFDGSSLPAGVYVVRASGETFSATRRATLVR